MTEVESPYPPLYILITRMTEQEEDEELLSDLNQAKKNVISFDESPNYIKVLQLQSSPWSTICICLKWNFPMNQYIRKRQGS